MVKTTSMLSSEGSPSGAIALLAYYEKIAPHLNNLPQTYFWEPLYMCPRLKCGVGILSEGEERSSRTDSGPDWVGINRERCSGGLNGSPAIYSTVCWPFFKPFIFAALSLDPCVAAGWAGRLFGKIWFWSWLCGFCQCTLQRRDGVFIV